jgi:CheY-like chemotaxis protein
MKILFVFFRSVRFVAVAVLMPIIFLACPGFAALSVISEPTKAWPPLYHLDITFSEAVNPVTVTEEDIAITDPNDAPVAVGSVEALEVFRQSPQQFDLVITDLNMPAMNGDRLAGELIRIRSDVPIILCTGFSERFDQRKAQSLGIRKLLMKPLDVSLLAESIRDVLDDS